MPSRFWRASGNALLPSRCVLGPAGGGGAWTPSTAAIAAKAWYDVSDISTLFQDTSGTVPVTADGQTVQCIKDKSGNNINLSAGNGIGWVYHTGTHPYVTATAQGTEYFKNFGFSTVFTDGSGQISLGAAFNYTSNTGNQPTVTGANAFGNLLGNNAGVLEAGAWNSSNGSIGVDTGSAITAGTGVALRQVTTTTTIECFVNGATNGSAAVSGTLNSGGDQLHIGAPGKFSALAIFPGALSSSDQASLDTWLSARAP